MPLNFHRIPASGEYRRKANKMRIHLLAFHSFVAPLSATLWIILWIVPPHCPLRLASASSASPVVNLSTDGGKKSRHQQPCELLPIRHVVRPNDLFLTNFGRFCSSVWPVWQAGRQLHALLLHNIGQHPLDSIHFFPDDADRLLIAGIGQRRNSFGRV